MIKVYLKHPLAPALLSELRKQLHDQVDLVTAEQKPGLTDYDILVDGAPSRDDLIGCPRLRVLVVPWAGAPIETLELMHQFPDIAVHSLHYNPGPTAEMAMALLLAAAKWVVPFDRRFRRHLWSPPFPGTGNGILLAGKTALIVGYGRVGRRIGNACRGLGMKVIAIRRTVDRNAPEYVFPLSELSRLLSMANVLLICVPHTAATEGLIGGAELERLPRDAILVNVARGLIVDEAALYEALKQRRLFGAGLDVWYQYPSADEREADSPVPPSRFPFHALDNVVMMPHRAGWSEETESLRIEHLAQVLNAAARGEAIPGRVDPIHDY